MSTLTPEQEALKIAAQKAIDSPAAWPFFRNPFDKLAVPESILALLAQLETFETLPAPIEAFSAKDLSALALELMAEFGGADDDVVFADGRAAGITAMYNAIKKRLSERTVTMPLKTGDRLTNANTAEPYMDTLKVQAIPAGWKLVPVEMTNKMFEAAGRALNGWWNPGDAGKAQRLWPVLLAAAPTFTESPQ